MRAVISNYLVVEAGNIPPQLSSDLQYEDLRPLLVQEAIATIADEHLLSMHDLALHVESTDGRVTT